MNYRSFCADLVISKAFYSIKIQYLFAFRFIWYNNTNLISTTSIKKNNKMTIIVKLTRSSDIDTTNLACEWVNVAIPSFSCI